MVYIFSYRSLSRSIFKSKNFFSNKPLFGAVALGFIEQLAAIYVPFLNRTLGITLLHPTDWLLVVSVSFGMMFLVELVKYQRYVKFNPRL